MALPQFLTDPVLLAVLAGLLALGLWLQRGVGYDRYQRIQKHKKRILPKLTYLWPHFIHNKGSTKTDPEFLAEWSTDLRTAFDTLNDAGASPHLICSLKKRKRRGGFGRQYSDLHFLWVHPDGTQTETYVFGTKDGVDVYAHNEAVVTEMQEHLSGKQIDGDPKDVVPKSA